MKKFNFRFCFPHKRVISALLALACLLGLLPTAAFAASPSTITLTDCDQSSQTYHSANLGDCHLHRMLFDYNGASRDGFCAEHGKGMGWSLEGQPWGSPQPVSDPTVKAMLAYYYTFTTGVFTDEVIAMGANQVWDDNMARYMNAWVQAVVWRYTSGTMGDPVATCAEELMYVYNSLDGANYTSIDDTVDGSSFRSRAQYTLDMGAQGMWGNCEVYRYTYAGANTSYHQASNVQAIMIGELTVPPPTTEDSYDLVIKKVDATNPSKGLAGTTFQVTSDIGFSQEVVTGSDGTYTLRDLEAGTYTVTETSAPEGYEFDPTPQYVTLPGGSNTVTVTFSDTPEEPGEGTIRKVDADDPTKGLAGAVIKIEGVDNDFVGTYTTGEGGYLTDVPWDKLPKGSYTATEVTPPEGYTKSPDTNKTRQTFEWDGKTDIALVFENDARVKVKLIKLDDADHPLPGAVFAIMKDGQVIGTEATKADGSITVTDVTEGLYAFVEVSAPVPYATLTEPVFAHVDQATINGGGTVTVTASDKKLPGLTILKKDEQTGNAIPGTTFEVKAIDGSYHNDVVTGADGKVVLSNIPAGSYEVTEKSVPDPYVVGEVRTQTIYLGPGEDRELIFDNMKQPELTISKVELGSNVPIPGTTFEIKAIDGDYRHDVTTGTDGTITLRVAPGSYRILEKSVPEPYCLAENEGDRVQTISLNAGESKALTFKNSKNPLLKISKIEKGTDEKISGTVFTIEAIDGDYRHEVTTGADGSVSLRVAPGSYKVTEKSVPGPYVVGDKPTQTISLHGGDEKELIFENLKKPLLTVAKIDADTHDVIPGTVFTIQGVSNDYKHDVTTGADGIVSLRVDAGTYRITEKSVPAPYYLPSLNADRVQTISLNPGDEKTVTFKNHKAPKLTIYKEDSVAGAPIEGAKFHVTYTSNGEAADAPSTINYGDMFTDSKGEIKLHEQGKKLYPGEYTVTEVAPAPGFQMKEPSTQKVIIHGGETKTVVFQNEPLNAIIIEKYDSVTHAALPGCTFQLRFLGGTSGTGGTVIGQKVTGKNGTAIWTGLKSGTYILEEVDPADGYSIINSSETVYLADSGEQSVITVRFDNSPDGILLVRKVCSVNPSVTLQDAEFKIAYADGTLIGDSNGVYRTDENGEISIPGLKPGKSVIVTETKAPAGFIIDTQSQTVQIKEGRTVSLTFKNQPKGKLIVQKRDSQTNEPLSGAEFRVTTAAGCEVGLDGVIGTATLTQNGLFTTDANGEIRISNLAPGAYVLTETKAPSGYVMDSPSTNVVIGPNGDTQTVIIKNTKKGNLVVEKYDSVTKQPLSGTQFKITAANGELTPDNEGLTSSNGLYTTNREGQIVLSKLLPGTYVVAETKAPDGYRQDPTPQTVVVNAGDTQMVRFYDDPLCTLTILKRDAVTKKPLAKAEFTVQDSEGRAIGPNNGRYVTGTDGTVTVTGMQPNATIVVSESKAPTGYIRDETPKNIVVRTGIANSLTFDDEPSTTLIIQKFVSGTENEPLSGVCFKVTDGAGAAVGPDDGVYFTDHAGEIVLTGLEPGTTVKAREIKTVEGFVLDGTPQDILIKGGEVQRLTFWNQRDCSLTIMKQSTSKEPLTGAVFYVTDEDGAAIGTNNGRYTSDRNGLITITGLQPGQVLVVTEEKAPNGYVRDMTPKIIKIKQGVANSLIFENAKAGSLVINKRCSVDKAAPLEGVTFKITTTTGEFLPDENGKISSNGLYYTDENGQIILNSVVGTLVVTEVKSIDGYTIHEANRSKTIEVKPDDTQTLYFYNDPLCSLTIKKLDSVTGKPVPNTEFTVKDGNGTVLGRYTTGKDGTVTVTGLIPNSTVVVVESKVPEGYVLNTTPQTITVRNGIGNSVTSGTASGGSSGGNVSGGSGSGNDLTFENDPKTRLIIEKYVTGTTTPLKGVAFLITDSSGEVIGNSNGEFTTDENGRIVVEGLEPGVTINVKEIRTLEGYLLDTTPKSIKIKAGAAQTLKFYNQKAGALVIRKLDSVTKKPLAGVEFQLTYSDGSYVDADNGHLSSKGLYTTDKNGEIRITGITGTIVATETRTIDGYSIDEATRTQTVKVNAQDTQCLTFYNAPIGGLELIKVSEADRTQRIPNVKFEVRRMDGGLVDTVTTNKQGRVYLALPAGNYYAVEIETAEGFKLDNTPHYFTVKDGKTTTLTVTNMPFSGVIIHKVDSVTGEGLYDVKFLVYDQNKNPIGEYSTDNEGYIYLDDLTVQGKGKLLIRELEAAPGYELDKEYKTVYVQPGKTVEITWENTPVTGQIQIQKFAAEYNDLTGTPAGAPLQGAVYEISEARSGKVVDYITTDARGVAASKPLPLGRYKISEATAPAYWQLSGTVFDETLEYSGQIIKLSDYDKPVKLGVTITKRGNAEALAGSQMRYDFTVANTSNVPLENYYWHDRIPTDAARATVFTTGTYSARLNYRILYKTNYSGEYRVLTSNLVTSSNYSFRLNAIPMQAGEYVTDVFLDFGKVPVGFQSVVQPTLTVQVLGTVANGYQIVNRADAGGRYLDAWQTAQAAWLTIVRRLAPPPTLPKTGY